MICSVCSKDKNWLHFVGVDNVCNKCIEKGTIFKEIRFSNEKRLQIVLKKRKIGSFKELCEMTEQNFDDILLTDPNIGNYKPRPNKLKKSKSDDHDDEIPIV